MRRAMTTLWATIVLFAVMAPVVWAQASGEGSDGVADDKKVTDTGFLIIAAVPLFILLMSLLQWRLDKRKGRKKAAVKAAGGERRWQGGW